MTRFMISTGIGLALLCVGAPAFAECDARVRAVAEARYGAGSAPFDPFSTSHPADNFDITIESATPECELALVFRSETARGGGVRTASAAGGGVIEYALLPLLAASAALESASLPQDKAALILPASAAGALERKATLFFQPVASADAPGAGRYADALEILVFGRTDGSWSLLDEALMSVSFEVPLVQDVRLSGDGGAFDSGLPSATLDFGEMETGEIQTVTLQVRSTGRYAVSMEAVDGWWMRSDGGGVVPVTALLDGARIIPEHETASVREAGGATGRDGRNHVLGVELGVVEDQPAGDYRGTILIRALPAY